MDINWVFTDESEGTYPYWSVFLNGGKAAMIVQRPKCYKLTIFTHTDEYKTWEFETFEEAKNAFVHEYVALRLEGKL